jgi:hypothetical protein
MAEKKLFGKCIFVQPDMKKDENVQSSFTNDRGMTTYDYYIKMEVGEGDAKTQFAGLYSSQTPHKSETNTQNKFVKGESRFFSYEEKVYEKKSGNGTWTKKKIKPERENEFIKGASNIGIGISSNTSYNDPKEIAQISMSRNQDNAIQAYIALKKEPPSTQKINGMALLFHNWCVDIKPLERGIVVRRAYCIKNAIISMANFKAIEVKPKMVDSEDNTKEIPPIKGITSSEHILTVAEQLYNAQINDEIYKSLIPPPPPPPPVIEEQKIEKQEEQDLPF